VCGVYINMTQIGDEELSHSIFSVSRVLKGEETIAPPITPASHPRRSRYILYQIKQMLTRSTDPHDRKLNQKKKEKQAPNDESSSQVSSTCIMNHIDEGIIKMKIINVVSP